MRRYFLISALYCIIIRNGFAQVNASDSLALVALYNATNGPNWITGWILSDPVSTWNGVYLNFDRVQELYLSENNLTGSLPSDIGNLNNLLILDLSHNNISGSIPSSIGNLLFLEDLNLNVNELEGNIPSNIGSLTALSFLQLGGNQLTGAIPSSIEFLTELSYLYLTGNNLNSIPVQLGTLTALEGLYLGDNDFNASIPDFIGNLTNLYGLDLSQNNFSGNLPISLSNLTNPNLDINLSANNLSGSFPAEFSIFCSANSYNFCNNPDLPFEGNYGIICKPDGFNITTEACDYYESPSGKIFNQSGIYKDTVTSSGGCLDIYEIDLTIHHSTSNTIFAQECFYFVVGEDTLYDSGNYSISLQTNNGCDSLIILTLEIATDPMYCGFLPGTPVINATAAILANDPHQSDFCAGMSLTSDGVITSANMEDILFKAGDQVELLPGFLVELGAKFHVDIGSCLE